MFKGVYTAIPTPFDENNEIDFKSLEKIIDFQISANVHGIVVAGSTGEGTSLSIEEYQKLVATSVKMAGGKISVIAGCPSNSTSVCVEMADISKHKNVDGIMCVVPYYNKPSQIGIVNHFRQINDSTKLPIIVYSVPSRTGIDISNESIVEISRMKNVVALKDASANLDRTLTLKAHLDGFSLLSGDDSTFLGFMAQGGDGIISVASNIVPHEFVSMYNFVKNNDYASAFKLHLKLAGLYKAIAIDSNPIPIKYAMSTMGLCEDYVRLPLVGLSESAKEHLKKAIKYN